jgi:hypothetical protein
MRLLFMATCCLSVAGRASAATGYTDWSRMSFLQQLSYIEGITDFMSLGSRDEPFRLALNAGVTDCSKQQQITLGQIQEDVGRLYGDYPNLRPTAPSFVVYVSLLRLCGDQINSHMTQLQQPILDWRVIIRNLSKSH